MVRLQLNDKHQFELSTEALVCLAEHVASNVKYESELVRSLLELDIPSITSAIVDNIDMDDVPSYMADKLWDNASNRVRYQMINSSILQNLTKKQVDDIIVDDYPRTLRYVAMNFEDTASSRQLDKSDRKKLLEFLRRHADKDVRKALANNDNVADLLEECGMDFSLDERLEINAMSVDMLKKHKSSEFVQFESLSSDNLEWLSEHIEDLDKQVKKRKALAQLVIDNKDPKFRQAMAKSSYMPRDILQMLADGEDQVASRYAKITMAEFGDEEEEDDE